VRSPPPATTRFLELRDGGRLAWDEAGSGDTTILWVHGLPLDRHSWAPQRAFFTERTRNLFVDLRGYGDSSKLPEGADVTSLYRSDLLTFIDSLGVTKPLVIGFASAGHVVLRLAAQHGERLSGVVSINGSPRFMRGDDWPVGFTQEELDHFAAPIRAETIGGALDRILDPETVFQDVPIERARELAATFRAMGERAGAATLLGFFDRIAHDDDRRLLADIDVPTLLITSVAGKEVSNQVARYMRDTIPRSTLVELAGTDHFAFATRPELINWLIDDFCTTLGQRL
jgi:pimeloyl-ACP methyl ester carboxylesterase